MNSRLNIQVNVPTETWVKRRLRTVGMQERGAIPRLDLMDRPTPSATTRRPKVEMPYRTIRLFVLVIISVVYYLTKVRRKKDISKGGKNTGASLDQTERNGYICGS